MRLNFNNIYIILVEPVYKGNVGSIARVMKNFGFNNLRIVGKIPVKEDFYMAVHAKDILNEAIQFDSLEDAISDLDRLIAITRREGKKKKIDFLPDDLAEHVQVNQNKIGLVFGRETYGLTDYEADLCDFRCFIPTSDKFGSLNLAQAVSVICYEISKTAYRKTPIEYSDDIASNSQIKESLIFIKTILEDIDYPAIGDIPKISRIIRRLLVHSNVSIFDLKELKHFFNRILILFSGKGKKIN